MSTSTDLSDIDSINSGSESSELDMEEFDNFVNPDENPKDQNETKNNKKDQNETKKNEKKKNEKKENGMEKKPKPENSETKLDLGLDKEPRVPKNKKKEKKSKHKKKTKNQKKKNSQNPDNPFLEIEETDIWEDLQELLDLNKKQSAQRLVLLDKLQQQRKINLHLKTKEQTLNDFLQDLNFQVDQIKKTFN
ncbi:hypothetical protein M0813_20733 [Anaeramoeba flamelloides]|uniref:Uncharacterized protein n=1 Tax=Anaeramoeba flamelloides TaxID=1746091 RepID=A0ABQ8YKF4_9EUKA|nr:hypothetical protein M0813_20733 [Anaeramoeba flamelloides]